jgi:hypothetical protein
MVVSILARKGPQMTFFRTTAGGRARRTPTLVIGGTCLTLLGLAVACAPAAPGSPTAVPNPTVQAAATEVGGAVRAVATAQGIAQPTVSAAQTQVAGSVPGAATAVAPTVSAAKTEIAPTVTAAKTQIAPTVSAAKTEIAPTVAAAREAAATAAAPTAQAIATQIAPTVQAVATQMVASVGTAIATSTVHVSNVSVTTADTTVSIQNTGASPMNLAGWALVMGPDLSVVLSDITIKAGQTRLLHFSEGTDGENDVYMGFGANIAHSSLQPGSRVILIQPPNQIASVYSVS